MSITELQLYFQAQPYALVAYMAFNGAFVGSFLNLFCYRYPIISAQRESGNKEAKLGFVRARSFCPSCKHSLSLIDIIPILSFVFLRGRCRFCKKSIAPRYAIVEIALATVYALFATYNGFTLNLLFNCFAVTVLLTITNIAITSESGHLPKTFIKLTLPTLAVVGLVAKTTVFYELVSMVPNSPFLLVVTTISPINTVFPPIAYHFTGGLLMLGAAYAWTDRNTLTVSVMTMAGLYLGWQLAALTIITLIVLKIMARRLHQKNSEHVLAGLNYHPKPNLGGTTDINVYQKTARNTLLVTLLTLAAFSVVYQSYAVIDVYLNQMHSERSHLEFFGE